MKTIDYSFPTFECMIKNNYLYVDKTEYLWKLITQRPQGIYLLSRPRRFGKSLTVSTLEAIFQGKKRLFEGLAIYDKYEWDQTYPVIQLDLSGFKPRNDDDLRNSLMLALERQRDNHKVKINLNIKSLKESFVNLISAVASRSTSGKVVILIDEYDAPISDTMDKVYVGEILNTLQGFYSAIKTCISLLRFVFITGVSKFSHVSIFSGLNNLNDISMDLEYATMLGYTQKELEENFAPYIDKAYEPNGMTREALLEKIKDWYNGFRFSAEAETVYNPYSVALFFSKNYEFNNYWSDTGNPSFLVEIAKQKKFDIRGAIINSVESDMLGTDDVSKIEPIRVLFQTGYLTIKHSICSQGKYQYWLGYPNMDVGESFNKCLLTTYTGMSELDLSRRRLRFKKALEANDLNTAMSEMETYFSIFPYPTTQTQKAEYTFQAIFIGFCFAYGVHTENEVCTSQGRIDATIEMTKRIYIFEFKLDNDSTALSTIKEKEYFRKYLFYSKEITLVGINFSSSSGKIIDFKSEAVDKDQVFPVGTNQVVQS